LSLTVPHCPSLSLTEPSLSPHWSLTEPSLSLTEPSLSPHWSLTVPH